MPVLPKGREAVSDTAKIFFDFFSPVCPDLKSRLSLGFLTQNLPKMKTRLNFFQKGQNAVKPLFNLNSYIKKSTLGHSW